MPFCDCRYKSLCPETWPNYHGPGSPRDAVELICRQLNYDHDDYRLGRCDYSSYRIDDENDDDG